MEDTEVLDTEDVEQAEEETTDGWHFPNGSKASGKRNLPKVRKRTIVDSPHKRCWMRQKGESVQAFEAFMTYLMLGKDRTFRQTGVALEKSYSLMQRWCWEWSWAARAAAYEEHFLLLRLDSFEASRDRMFVRHESISEMALQLVDGELMSLLAIKAEAEKEAADSEEPAKMVLQGDALIRLFDLAIKNHRSSVIGRIEAAAKTIEEKEALAERYSDELVSLMQQFMQETEMTGEQQEKAKAVLENYLKGNTKEIAHGEHDRGD